MRFEFLLLNDCLMFLFFYLLIVDRLLHVLLLLLHVRLLLLHVCLLLLCFARRDGLRGVAVASEGEHACKRQSKHARIPTPLGRDRASERWLPVKAVTFLRVPSPQAAPAR